MKASEIILEAPRQNNNAPVATPQDMYYDFQLIKQMKASPWTKIRVAGDILAQNPNVWQVTGITVNALKRFKENDFRKTSGMKINRAHKVDRAVWLKELLSKDLPFEQWWQFYQQNDQTVLATTEENMSRAGMSGWSQILTIDQALGLFKASGFAWKHNQAERNFLMMLDNVNKHLTSSQ